MVPLISIVIANLLGYLLKFYGLDRYVILAGFRFHLSFIIPFVVLLFSGSNRQKLKSYLVKSPDRKFMFTALFILLPLMILLLVLFLLNSIDLSDPDYFYELGLTSILDYPVYLFWNFPQILMFALFILVSVNESKARFLLTLLYTASLFVYEFIPLAKGAFPLWDLIAFIIAALLFASFLSVIRNVYLFCIVTFSVIWSNLLLFGSSSKVLVRLFLAGTYDSWEGFFSVNKSYSGYMMIAQLSLALVLFFIPFILNSRRIRQMQVNELNIGNVSNDTL